MINNLIKQIAYSTDSFYLYEESVINSQIKKLKENFENIEFIYSVKCNPNRNVLNTIFENGLGADAASPKEVQMSYEVGVDKSKIFYSAPGKTEQDIKQALTHCIVIADSLSEIMRISQIAGDDKINIGIRINPDFSMDTDKGAPSKFGIDETAALEFISRDIPENINILGIHIHVKSQVLDEEKLKSYYEKVILLSERVENALGYSLDFLNMGSGIGVAYSEEDKEIDIEKLGNEIKPFITEFKKRHPNTRLIIESGRYITCKSGRYFTHVADKKISYGKTYVILQNTLNGFLRPSIARMVESYAGENAKGCEPLFTCTEAFTVKSVNEGNEYETVTLVGNLCTGADVIAENIYMPKLEVGDIVEINNAGSYGIVLSPMQFSSQVPVKEFLLCENGDVLD